MTDNHTKQWSSLIPKPKDERKPRLLSNRAVKHIANMNGVRGSMEITKALTVVLEAIVARASERAKKNGRLTIRPYDL